MAEETKGPAETAPAASPKPRKLAANGGSAAQASADTTAAASSDGAEVQPAAPAESGFATLQAVAASAESGHKHGGAGHKKKKKHKGRIEHNIPGRIRMKIPAAKSDPAVLNDYVAAFTAMPGVAKVVAKPETGSITLHYDPRIEAEFADRLHHCCQHHELHVETGPPEDEVNRLASRIAREADFLADHSPLAKGTVDFFKGFDRELKLVSNNAIDLKIFLASGLAAFTFLEIGAAAATPMWVTLALFGVNHFVELQRTPGSEAESPSTNPGPPPAARPEREPATQR